MSDEQTAEVTATVTETQEKQAEQPKPTETVEFWKQKAREQEKRAKENATAAQRLAEIEESQKSEAEKAADRIRQLESEAESARRDAVRFRVASKYGISDEDADLFLTASDEDTLTLQAEKLADRTSHSPRPDPTQGGTGATKAKTTAEEFAEWSEANF